MTGTLIFALALAGSAVTAVLVSAGEGRLTALFTYLVAVGATLALVARGQDRSHLACVGRRLGRPEAVTLALLVLFQLALARFFSGYPLHYHYDEFITAFASTSLADLRQIDWFAGYPPLGWWVDQFPIVFFALQKPFLMLLGESVEGLRMSVWPYLALIVVLTYLIARDLSARRYFPEVAALVAIVFAPSAYISSLGVHFTSSTACLLAALYSYTRLVGTGDRRYAALLGLSTALGYLTYTGSYVVAPLLVVFALVDVLFRRSLEPARRLLPTIPVVLVILLPFLVYALTEENYFLQRVDQVNSLDGTRTMGAGLLQDGEISLERLREHLSESVRAVHEAGVVGAAQSYTFGGQPLFTPVALALFLVGLGVACYEGLLERRTAWLNVVATVLASFVLVLALTVPVASIHRLSPVYPLIGILVAAGIFATADAVRRAPVGLVRRSVPAVLVGVLVLYIGTSLSSAHLMAERDQGADSVLIARYVDEHVPPDKTVAIGAFPAYHLARELYFRSDRQVLFETKPIEALLESSDADVVIALGKDVSPIDAVRPYYPDLVVIDAVDGVGLQNHLIVLRDGSGHGIDSASRVSDDRSGSVARGAVEP